MNFTAEALIMMRPGRYVVSHDYIHFFYHHDVGKPTKGQFP